MSKGKEPKWLHDKFTLGEVIIVGFALGLLIAWSLK